MWIKIKKSYAGVEGLFVKDETRYVDDEKLAKLKKLGRKNFQYQETVPPHERLIDHEVQERDAAQQEFRRLQAVSINARDLAQTTTLAAEELGKSVETTRAAQDQVDQKIEELRARLDDEKVKPGVKKETALQVRELSKTRLQYAKLLADADAAGFQAEWARLNETDARIAATAAAAKLSELDPNFNFLPTEAKDETATNPDRQGAGHKADANDATDNAGEPEKNDHHAEGQTTPPGS